MYEHHIFAVIALAGTYAAAIGILWLTHRSPWTTAVQRYKGMSPPFLSVIGVLFALNLAFLANDTWNAQDRARDAVYQESGALHVLIAASAILPEPHRQRIADAVTDYAAGVVEMEWPLLAHRQNSIEVGRRLDAVFAAIAVADGPEAAVMKPSMMQAVQNVRSMRGVRVALSQTHVNPLKWLGMAFLGLLTMISIVLVHIDLPRAGFLTVMVFATASAPTAAIIVVQGNPYQQPTSVSAAPFAALLR